MMILVGINEFLDYKESLVVRVEQVKRVCFLLIVQGGSDISGTLSKLHCRIEKHFFLLIILHQIVSAICRSINKNNNTDWSKVESTGSYNSRDSK
jgi:hypothetical protein